MRRKIWCFATALTALLSTAAADAKPIEYTFSGTGDWTLNGLTSPESTSLAVISAKSVPLDVNQPRA